MPRLCLSRLSEGKEKVTRKALNPILRLRDKLHGLGFVDPGIAPVVQRLDAGLAQLPKSGALEGEVLTQLMERVLLLCSVEQMERCAESLATIDPPETEEPVKTQKSEHQEEPVIEQTAVVPMEGSTTTATFYF